MPPPPRPANFRASASLAAIALACVAIAAACKPVIAAAGDIRAAEWTPAQETTSPQYTFQARVPLTTVDVTVTDAKGNPVHGLKQSDFTILEDGKQMQPNSFEEHRSDQTPPPPTATLVKQTLPPDTFTNVAPGPSSSRPFNILLFDALNTPKPDQQVVVKRMLDYVGTIPPGTQMAVMRITTRLTILQGFTTDPTLIRAALTSKRDTAWDSPVSDPDTPAGGNTEVEASHSSFQGQYLISAFRQIAGFASNLPGRKNLIWFSGAFPTQFPPAPDPYAFPTWPPNAACGPSDDDIPNVKNKYQGPCMKYAQGDIYDLTADLKSVSDLLARAHVVVYPIDARGLQIPDEPVTVDTSTTRMTNRMNLRTFEHSTMDDIADFTGGHAFYNTNGFAQAVQQAIAGGSNFYALTYIPTGNADSRFRSITVKVARPNVHLAYRDGYYALPPGATLASAKVPRPIPQPTPLQVAMTHGAPGFTDVLFNAHIARTAETSTLPDDNQHSSSEMKPPYRLYAITYTTDIHSLAFTKSADGAYSADFEFVVTLFNADGEALNSTTREVQPIIPESTYQSMLRDGAIAHQEIAVPVKGDFTLRLAVHDLTSNRIGALEIPTSSIKPAPVPAIASSRNP